MYLMYLYKYQGTPLPFPETNIQIKQGVSQKEWAYPFLPF